MSERRTLLVHSLIYGIGSVLTPVAQVVLLPLYTNYLTPADFGTLDIIFRTAAVINIVLMTSGIRTATLTFYKQATDEDRPRIAATISLFVWLMISGAVLMSILLAVPLDNYLQLGSPLVVAVGLTMALAEPLTAVPMTLMQARLESLRYVIVSLLIAVIRITLCVAMVAWLGWGLWGVLVSQFLVALLFGFLLTLRELRIGSFFPDFTKWRDVVQFCWPFIPGGVLFFVYCTADRYFLLGDSPYATKEEALAVIGVYALASKLADFIKTFGPAPLFQVWTSKMYDYYHRDDAPDLFGRFYLKMLVVFVFPALALAVFASELIRTFCSGDYAPTIPLIPLLCLNATLAANLGPAECTYYITRKTIYKPWVNAITLMPLLLLMAVLVPRYGVYGVITAHLCCTVFNLVVTIGLTQRFFRVEYRVKQLLLLGFIAIACYLLSLFCGEGISTSTLLPEEFEKLTQWDKVVDAFSRVHIVPILLKTLCLALWFGLIWVGGVFQDDDKEVIRAMVATVIRKVVRHR